MMENMKEKWQEFQTILEELTTVKRREYLLMLAVCVLSGLVIGMLISPKKRVLIGSNNGNNVNSNLNDPPQECEDNEADAEV